MKSPWHQRTALAGLVLLAAAAPVAAQAPASPNHLYDKVKLFGSVTNVWLGSTIRVDESNGTPGSDVTTDDLGLTGITPEPMLGVRWRPGRRHEIEASYLFVRHSGTHVLQDTVQIQDSTFAAGLRVDSKFRSDQLAITYRFAFSAGERHLVGAAIGIGALFFQVNMDAIAGATSGGPDTTIVPFQVTVTKPAPTGSLGLFGRWRAGDRWFVDADIRALSLNINRIDIKVVEGGVAGRRYLSSSFALEAAYGLTAVQVKLAPRSTGNGLSGRVRYGMQNLRLGAVWIP